jgi:hypothetical protein
MRKTVYVSEGQQRRMDVLRLTMPEVIEAGIGSYEGAGPLRSLAPDLAQSVQKTIRLLEVMVRGRLAVVADSKVTPHENV